MATVRPFTAIRPKDSDTARLVAALPFDVMSSGEAREMTVGKPLSFLHVDKAEIDLPEGTYIYDDNVYLKARDNLNKMMSDGVFFKEDSPCFYIYREIMEGRSQYGIVACTSINEYIDGTIKKHELTLEEKEIDRMRHVDTLNANTGPIFLTYKTEEKIDRIVSGWIGSHDPVYDFVPEDDAVRHTVWVVDSKDAVDSISNSFTGVRSLYIADGHHRNASAVRVGLNRRDENPDAGADAEFNFYLSVIVPSNQLKIFDYNRVVKDLNGLTADAFFEALKSRKFSVSKFTGGEYRGPSERHTFGMFYEGCWYTLTALPDIINDADCVESLDVSVLQKHVLSPILGIDDPRTSKRIEFVGGIRGISELERCVNNGAAVAFAMFPTSIDEVMSIADENRIMPPKSTWFEPKLRSGLFIHSLK